MTPDERDRLTRTEADLRNLKEWTASIDKKLDDLLAAAHMGKGAWWLLLRIGGVLAAIAAVGAWVFDKLHLKV